MLDYFIKIYDQIKSYRNIHKRHAAILKRYAAMKAYAQRLEVEKRLRSSSNSNGGTNNMRGLRSYNSMFKIAQKAQSLGKRISADIYVVNEAQSLLAAICLKRIYGGKIVWYVKEHPFLLKRNLTFEADNYSTEYFKQLDGMTQAMVKEVDRSICTGFGYVQLMEQLGVPSIDITRRRDEVCSSNSFNTHEFLNINPDVNLLFYGSTIYNSCDFEGVAKLLWHLGDSYHLVHTGTFETKDLQKRIIKYCQNLKIDDRLHFLGFVDRNEMNNIASGCDVGIIHLNSAIENCLLSFHNRFADCMAACLPFVYSDNISMNHIDPEGKYSIQYPWIDIYAMASAIKYVQQHHSEMRNELLSARSPERQTERKEKLLDQFCGAQSVTFLSINDVRNNDPTIELVQLLGTKDTKISILSGINIAQKINNSGYFKGVRFYEVD